jgi:hypothetical protein
MGYVSKPSGMKEGDKRHFAGEIMTLYYQKISEIKKWIEEPIYAVGPKWVSTNVNVACNEVLNCTSQQWRCWFFSRPGRAVTMAAPDRNCELKKNCPFNFLSFLSII